MISKEKRYSPTSLSGGGVSAFPAPALGESLASGDTGSRGPASAGLGSWKHGGSWLETRDPQEIMFRDSPGVHTGGSAVEL